MNRKLAVVCVAFLAIVQGIVLGQSGYVLPYTTGFWHFADNSTPRRVLCSAVAPDGDIYVISEFHPDLFCSKDGGATWNNIQIGSGDFLLKTLAISAKGEIYVGAADEFKLYRSCDSGETWQALPAVGADCKITSIYLDSNENLFIITRDNQSSIYNCYRSNDGNMHWTRLGESITCLAFFDNKVYAGTQGISDYYWVPGGSLLISMDNGDTWATDSSPTGYPILDLLINKKGFIFVQTGGTQEDRPAIRLVRSQDGGSTWQEISCPYGENGQMICSANDDLFTSGWFSAISRSTDDGDTWINLPIHGYNILLDNFQKLLVFEQLREDPIIHSLYSSTDKGDSWTLIQSGFGLALTYQYRILVTSDGHIYAAVGNSLRKSYDNGKTWPFSTIMPVKMIIM